MKKQLVGLALVSTVTLGAASPALAGASTDAALALGAFAVFNQLVRGDTVLNNLFGAPASYVVAAPQAPVVYAPPPQIVYSPPPTVIYPPPAVIYPTPPPVISIAPAPTIVYPGYVCVLRGRQWVWIPQHAYWNRGGHGHGKRPPVRGWRWND